MIQILIFVDWRVALTSIFLFMRGGAPKPPHANKIQYDSCALVYFHYYDLNLQHPLTLYPVTLFSPFHYEGTHRS